MTSFKVNQKRIEKLIEEATVDAYTTQEQFVGFCVILEEEMKFPFKAKVLGEEVEILSVFSRGNRILAKVKKDSRQHGVDILDLQEITERGNVERIEAYRQWHNDALWG